MQNFTGFIIIISLLLVFSELSAQKHNNNWIQQSQRTYGITFNQYADGSPDTMYVPNQAQRARTIISDSAGNLQMYLGWDGLLYDSNHHEIRGSRSLRIHQYGSHASLLFPYPGSNSKYILIHSENNPKALYYSIIEVINGRKRVTSSNKVLAEGVYGWSTQLARHTESDQNWLMVHNANSDSIISFHFSPEGYTGQRVRTNLPAKSYTDAKGPYMVLTPDSDIFATRILDFNESPKATYLLTGFFNKETGKVDHMMVIDTFRDGTLVRSLALSPKGQKLYVNTSRGKLKTIDQYDLMRGNARQIARSRVTLIRKQRLYWGDFAMMTGPDGKIYFSRAKYENKDTSLGTDKLGVIHFPERTGQACEIEHHPSANWGRPPNIPLASMNTGFIHVDRPYPGITSRLSLINTAPVPDSVHFHIYRDGGKIETITDPIASFTFRDPDKYRIEAEAFYAENSFIFKQWVNVYSGTKPRNTAEE